MSVTAFPVLNHPPRRVVSLVPSITESLFELGFGQAVVGITNYCVLPEKQLEGITRVGGPKNPEVEAILALLPDLVVANQEENSRQAVEALRASGILVWVSFPRSVRQAVEFLLQLAGVFQDGAAQDRVQSLAALVEQTRAIHSEKERRRFFCPIWRDWSAAGVPWWMTFNRNTYMHDLLDLLGGENVCARRERRYPLEADLGLSAPQEAKDRDRRYPRITFDEIRRAQPELILLPSEPYAFGDEDQQEFEQRLPGVQVKRVEGSLLTWHGTRVGRALTELANLFDPA
jgi:iron complex transport system substrate-binding protein